MRIKNYLQFTVNKEYKVINTSNTHNHKPHNDQVNSRETIGSSLKRKANNDLHILPSKLIRRNLQIMEDNKLII